jgi:hypothetical protein
LYGVEIFNNSRIVGQANGDQVQEVWFLAWPAHALPHLMNPFQSTAMNHPWGVNLLTNTSMPLLGFLGMPLTWLFGPVVTYTIFLRLGMVLSAASMQFVARRLGISRSGALVAGLIYGFSTMQVTQGSVHLFLVFAPLPPLMFYSLYCGLIQRWSPRRAGVTLGALFAADFLVSAEQALIAAIAIAVGLVVAAALYPRAISHEIIGRLGVISGCCVGLAGVILAIPVVEMNSHAHVSGTVHPWIQSFVTDAASIVLPGPQTWLHPIHFVESASLALRDGENGAYIGIALLALVTWGCVKQWRRPLVRVSAVTTLVVLGLSLGRALNVDGHVTALHSPYSWFASVPYVQNILPVRFMSMVWIGVATLAGVAIDSLVVRVVRARSESVAKARTWSLGAASCVAIVLISLLPAHSYSMVRTRVEPWLKSSELTRVIAPGSTVLFYPFPLAESNHAMLVQAVSGFEYNIIGGEAIVGDRDGRSVGISKLLPAQLPEVFIWTWECSGVRAHKPLACLVPVPQLNSSTIQAFHEYVARNHVGSIVMERARTHAAKLAQSYLRAAFGAPIQRGEGRVLVWNRVALRSGS